MPNSIRFEASARTHAESLAAVLGQFDPELVQANGSWQVEVRPHEAATDLVVELFNAVGAWLVDARLAACRVYFSEQMYTLLVPPGGTPGDAAQFLAERTMQLQQALETRLVIEQAKGVLGERFHLGLDAAFDLLRRAARNNGIKIHDLAGRIVSSPETPAEIRKVLDR